MVRVIIVGVGGIGAMAAWQLAQAGHEVVALEQFSLDHDRGSSYGDSRIVRRVYADALYTALMADAYPLWDTLQAQFPDEELFRRAGGIFFGPADHPQVRAAQEALETSQVEYEALGPAACARRFPAVVLQPEEVALYEPSMGYARASLCVRAAATLARRYGAQIREETAVAAIQTGPGGQGVRVTTPHGENLEADRLLLTSGPWLGPLLESLGVTLPLAVTRQPYVHLLPDSHAADFEVGRFPVWIDAVVEAYGFPRMGALPGVKIGLHRGGAAATPENVDRNVHEEDYAGPRRYAARRFPWLSPQVAYAKVCLYTNTPDEDFLIDSVPGLPDVFLLGGCSGHGFKFTPLLGRIGAALAAGAPVPYDLSRFRLARFASNQAALYT
ncbi:MAG TPA: N-methyl-L-tryptophan oxidase [Chthonomonadaceae bacterium]|nr:N-methyl-L-tryptophan oxidase [Chthonomonadaceae bacterium]